MITGFGEITCELTEYEKTNLLPKIVEILNRAIGKSHAVTNNQIISALQNEGFKTTSPRIRKIIHEIRVNNIVKGILATSKGYFISNNRGEIATYISSLYERESSIRDVSRSLEDYLIEISAVPVTV